MKFKELSIRTAASAVEHSTDNRSKMLIIILKTISAVDCYWTNTSMKACDIETPFICYWFFQFQIFLLNKEMIMIIGILWKKKSSICLSTLFATKYSNILYRKITNGFYLFLLKSLFISSNIKIYSYIYLEWVKPTWTFKT